MHVIPRSIASNPSFAVLWISRLCSVASTQILTVAVGWQLYDLTNDPLDLGLVGLFQFVPVISLTLVVGSVADRYDRRMIVAACRVIAGICAAALAVATLGGWVSAGVVFAIMAALGCAQAFENPTMTALMPGLVSRSELSRATVWYATSGQFARITAPALGGLLYLLGPTVAYSVAAALFLLAALSMIPLKIQRNVRPRSPMSLESVFAGLLFAWRTPVIFGSISLDLFVVLFGGATALLPIYARDILQTGPEGLGLLRSAPAAGALVTSAVLMIFPITSRVGPILLSTVTIFGLATIMFAFSTNLALSLGALVVLGASNLISAVIRQSVMQLRTPDEMRGRVTAVHSLFTGTSNQLGDFESGLTAALFGAVPAVVIGGLGTVLVAGLWTYIFPDIRRLDTFDSRT